MEIPRLIIYWPGTAWPFNCVADALYHPPIYYPLTYRLALAMFSIMDTEQDTPKPSRPQTDYCDPDYWTGLIKMSMSKFFVLCVINQKARHGYEITKAVEQTTNGCCAPTPGALYPVLREFEQGGYVTVSETVVQGRTRKVYQITDKGREAFKTAANVWMNIGQCITASAEGIGNDKDCC